jgi:hypothetical protein
MVHTIPPNLPTVAKITYVGNRDQRLWTNTIHIAKTGGGNIVEGDMEPLAHAAIVWWHNFYRTVVPTFCILDQVQVRKLDPTNPLAVDTQEGLPEGGAITANQPLPGNVSLALSERTLLAGRKYRGRIFVPGIGNQSVTVDDRAVSNLTNAAISAMFNMFATFAAAGPFVPTVFHWTQVHDFDTPITHFVVDAILDSMRRRLPGRGR